MAKKKKKSKGYLYIAVFFALICVGLIVAIIAVATGCGGEESTSSAVSEEISESSVISEPEQSKEGSAEESAEASAESSEEESSEPVSEYKSEFTQPERTIDFEKSIGITYKIDMTDYEQYVQPENELQYVYVVNAAHPLTKNDVPANLVDCKNMREGRSSKMVFVAERALDAFIKEAEANGYHGMGVTNAYRSYDTQNWWFNHYLEDEMKSGKYATKEEAIAKVLTYSTRPGTSEHQTGLTCDMNNVDLSNVHLFDHSETALWMEENAYRFGFILRYPEGTQEITGIIYESWHFRFVGRTAAKEIHDKSVELGRAYTLDEYVKELGIQD